MIAPDLGGTMNAVRVIRMALAIILLLVAAGGVIGSLADGTFTDSLFTIVITLCIAGLLWPRKKKQDA